MKNLEISQKINREKQKYDTKRREEPGYKLRKIISNAIYCALAKYNLSKGGSILDYLYYTMEELKKHIESLFEPWMTWENWGVYDPETWDDNDKSTWTWQLDHIIPASTFKYTSMDDSEFQKCWALSNLRPLNAKHNISESVKSRLESLKNAM